MPLSNVCYPCVCLSRPPLGAAACSECTGACILDGSSAAVTGGATSLSINFCNFDADAVTSSSLSFGVAYPVTCDAENATIPQAASLTAADGCSADACAVNVTLKSALDWAIALHGSSGVNSLTASLDGAAAVTVATFQDVASAVMSSMSASVSVCATDVGVSGSRLSFVKECNAAELCRGASGDTACTTQLQDGVFIDDVQCSGEACTGSLQLQEPLPCDGASGDATALIVGVQVATSTQSNYLSVGSMVDANFSISGVSGIDVGSSELRLATDSFCEASSINLSLSIGNSKVDVSSVNSTTNGSVVVDLSSPLGASLEGDDVTISLSQCGVSADTYTTTVGADPDGSDDDSASTSDSDDSAGFASTSGTNPVGSTQETNSSAGLSGGLYVGIGIGIVAFLGFVFECWIHKRRQQRQPAVESTVGGGISYANTA